MTKTPTSSSTPISSYVTENGCSDHDSLNEGEFFQFTINTPESAPPAVDDTKLQLATAGMTFLFNTFNYAIFTLAYKGKGAPHVVFYTKEELAKAITDAYQASKQRKNVYFMVNEGDGSARNAASIHYLSKSYIDADGCELPKILAYLETIQLTPHLITETSPGRYHIYFFFTPIEKTFSNLNRWEGVQEMLMRLGDTNAKPEDLGLDPSMTDHSKLLRVPGYPHPDKCTDTHPVVAILTDNTGLPYYTFEDLFTLTNATLRSSLPKHERKEPKPDNFSFESDAPIKDGERNFALHTEAFRLAKINTPAEALVLFKDYVFRKVERSDTEYICGSELTKKALDCLTSAFIKIEKENKEKETARIEVIKQTIEKPVTSLWHKPDSFYLNAPNDIGNITQQMMEGSIKPSAPLSFATGLTGRSIFRAKETFTPLGGSCALYTLCVADTGRGKDAPNTLLQNTFNHCGYRNLIENEFISSAGIDNHLESNQGLGFWLVDEIGSTMANMQKKGAADYKTEILAKLLKLFSLGNKQGWSSPKKSNTNKKGGNKQIYIDYPRAAILGYTVPSTFNKIFTPESIDIGLLQRFIYVVVPHELPPINESPNPRTYIQSDLFPVRPGVEFDDNGNCIYTLEASESSDVNFKSSKPPTLNWSPSVKRDFYEFAAHLDNEAFLIISEDQERYREAALYTRTAELALRIATTISVGDTLTMDVWEFGKEMMSSSLKAILDTAKEHILVGKGTPIMAMQERIVKKVCQLCIKHSKDWVFASAVHNALQNQFENSTEFYKVLNEAAKTGRVLLIQNAGGTRGLGVKVNIDLNNVL